MDRDDADIGEFCKEFLELFGEKQTQEKSQKATALRLYSMHTGRKIQAGRALPAEDLELFELAWDPQAPARCRACLKPVADVAGDSVRKNVQRGVPHGRHADHLLDLQGARDPPGRLAPLRRVRDAAGAAAAALAHRG